MSEFSGWWCDLHIAERAARTRGSEWVSVRAQMIGSERERREREGERMSPLCASPSNTCPRARIKCYFASLIWVSSIVSKAPKPPWCCSPEHAAHRVKGLYHKSNGIGPVAYEYTPQLPDHVLYSHTVSHTHDVVHTHTHTHT